jgi:hypothetical protein
MKAVDIFLLYSFIRRLVTPFNKWKAYQDGTIDDKGNVLIKRKQLTGNAKNNFGLFDVLILNLKKLLAKVPGGSAKLATFAAALFLLKEEKNINETNIDEYVSNLPSLLEDHWSEAKVLMEEEGGSAPIANTSKGNIARKNDKSTVIFKKIKRKKDIYIG